MNKTIADMNTRNNTNTILTLTKLFNTINFTAKPIKGGTPPKLKKCIATMIFLILSLVATSLNFNSLPTTRITTTLVNIIQ